MREGKVFSPPSLCPTWVVLLSDDDHPYLLAFLSGRCFRRCCQEVISGAEAGARDAERLDPGLLRAFPRSPWRELGTAQRLAAVQASTSRLSLATSSKVSPCISSNDSSTVPPCLAGVGADGMVVGLGIPPPSFSFSPVVSPVVSSFLSPAVKSVTCSGPVTTSEIEQSVSSMDVAHQLRAWSHRNECNSGPPRPR